MGAPVLVPKRWGTAALQDSSNLRHLGLTGLKRPTDTALGGQLISQNYAFYSIACEMLEAVLVHSKHLSKVTYH